MEGSTCGRLEGVDTALRDWLRTLARPPEDGGSHRGDLSEDAARYLVQIAGDGALKAALTEIGRADPDLAD